MSNRPNPIISLFDNIPVTTENPTHILEAFELIIKDFVNDFNLTVKKAPIQYTHTILTGLSNTKHPYYNAPCDVRPSTYGRGVFATRDIKKGDTITIYPIHGIVLHTLGESAIYSGNVEYDSKYAYEHTCTKTDHVGDKDKTEPLFLGHIINDNYPSVEDFNTDDDVKLGATYVKYLLHSISFANCAFKETQYFTIVKALKDIKKDDELFVSYGLGYWTDYLLYNDTKKYIHIFGTYLDTLDPKKRKFVCELFIKHSLSL